jgi:hypothetical protein
MKHWFLIVCLCAANSVYGSQTGIFAKSGRLLTIEQWRNELECIVWAVQDRQIVIYRLLDYSSRKGELIAIKPITAEQFESIRDAVQKLPSDALGFVHDPGEATDAPLLRLCFTSNGSLDVDGMELCGCCPRWLDKLVATVSLASQPEAPIDFPKIISEFRARIGAYVTVPLPEEPIPHKTPLRVRHRDRPKPWWNFWD